MFWAFEHMSVERQIAAEIACCQEFALFLTKQLGTNESAHTEYILTRSRELFEKENIKKHIKSEMLKKVSNPKMFNREEVKKIAMKSKYMSMLTPDEVATWEILNA
jgi:nicotinamide mononucleotide adenylyltransferase